jgi:hypothetical protein
MLIKELLLIGAVLCSQLGVELTRWIKHQKSIATRNSQATKKTMMFYTGPIVFDI